MVRIERRGTMIRKKTEQNTIQYNTVRTHDDDDDNNKYVRGGADALLLLE